MDQNYFHSKKSDKMHLYTDNKSFNNEVDLKQEACYELLKKSDQNLEQFKYNDCSIRFKLLSSHDLYAPMFIEEKYYLVSCFLNDGKELYFDRDSFGVFLEKVKSEEFYINVNDNYWSINFMFLADLDKIENGMLLNFSDIFKPIDKETVSSQRSSSMFIGFMSGLSNLFYRKKEQSDLFAIIDGDEKTAVAVEDKRVPTVAIEPVKEANNVSNPQVHSANVNNTANDSLSKKWGKRIFHNPVYRKKEQSDLFAIIDGYEKSAVAVEDKRVPTVAIEPVKEANNVSNPQVHSANVNNTANDSLSKKWGKRIFRNSIYFLSIFLVLIFFISIGVQIIKE